MQQLRWGDEYRTTLLCVDGYDAGVLRGRFYHPVWPEGRQVQSLTQFLLQMEDLLNEIDRPQSDTVVRRFRTDTDPRQEGLPAGREGKGDQATFRLRVLFRQHTSWQGEITWVENGQTQRFRSVLELIHLLDSALVREGTKGGNQTKGA